MKNKKGFTLAEVLITLGIIGVVAALTIPILINNNQKTQYVTGLKKAYSQMNQALVQMAADNNCVGDLVCTGLFASDKTTQDLGNEIVKYFKVVKNCETITTGCWADNYSSYYDGLDRESGWDVISGDVYKFVTADGISYSFNPHGNGYNCDLSGSASGSGPLSQFCSHVTIDVNGLKGPNNYGRDIFFFYITNGRGPLLYPEGGSDDGYHDIWINSGNPQYCYPDNTYGLSCAGRIIEEGWKMNY